MGLMVMLPTSTSKRETVVQGYDIGKQKMRIRQNVVNVFNPVYDHNNYNCYIVIFRLHYEYSSDNNWSNLDCPTSDAWLMQTGALPT